MLRINLHTEYAAWALQYLYEHQGKSAQPGEVIANATGIPYSAFMKIARRLKLKGLICPVRGSSGGYTLGKPAEEISFYDVFTAIEGELWITHCLEKGQRCGSGEKSNCAVDVSMQTVQDNIIEYMSGASLVDLTRSDCAQHVEGCVTAK